MAEIDDEFKNAMGDMSEEQGGSEEVNEVNEEENKPKLTPQQEAATVGAVVDFAGALVAKVKHVPPEYTPQFLADYHSMSDPLLTLIGFGTALSKLPVSALSPTKVVLIGVGMLGVAAIFTKAPVYNKQQAQKSTPNQSVANAQASQAQSIMNEQAKSAAQQAQAQQAQAQPKVQTGEEGANTQSNENVSNEEVDEGMTNEDDEIIKAESWK